MGVHETPMKEHLTNSQRLDTAINKQTNKNAYNKKKQTITTTIERQTDRQRERESQTETKRHSQPDRDTAREKKTLSSWKFRPVRRWIKSKAGREGVREGGRVDKKKKTGREEYREIKRGWGEGEPQRDRDREKERKKEKQRGRETEREREAESD